MYLRILCIYLTSEWLSVSVPLLLVSSPTIFYLMVVPYIACHDNKELFNPWTDNFFSRNKLQFKVDNCFASLYNTHRYKRSLYGGRSFEMAEILK
jgi:hypothetical protein